MSVAAPYPIDFAALEKGHVITVSEVERITGTRRTDRKYELKVLSLRESIERGLAELGKFFTLRIDQGAIRVLTDDEASLYNHKSFNRSLRGISRAHFRQVNVDVNCLDDDGKKRHMRSLEITGKVCQAISTVKSLPSPMPHKRRTPGLPSE